jgi:hypothetical protein
MALISLTEYGTGLAFYLDDSQIEMVYSTVIDGTTVSQIQRSAPHNTGYNTLVFVTQNLAAILGASGKLISLSISKDGNQFVTTLVNASINHFGTVQAPTGPNPPATANSQFDYFHNGSTMEVYYSTATPAAIAAAIVAKGPQLA